MEKRMFEVLDEMNVADGINKTQYAAVCPDLVSAQTVKNGGHITMGVPAELVHKALVDKNTRFILLAIDYKEYERVKNLRQPEPPPPSEGELWREVTADIMLWRDGNVPPEGYVSLQKKFTLTRKSDVPEAVKFGKFLNREDFVSTRHPNKMRSLQHNDSKPMDMDDIYALFLHHKNKKP